MALLDIIANNNDKGSKKMNKQVLVLCDDNSALSILAQAILNKYLADIEVQSAGIRAAKSIDKNVKSALVKDGSWSDSYTSKAVDTLLENEYDLVISLSEKASKKMPEFSDNTTIIAIEYDDENYENSTNLERLIKTLKMELIPITRDVLEL